MKTVWKIILCSLAAVALIGLLVWMLVFHFQLPVIHLGSSFDDSSYTVMDASGEVSIADSIRALDISWSSGSVKISTYDGNEIILRETAQKKDSDRLRYQVENGMLRIRERNSSLFSTYSKDLELLLPAKSDFSVINVDVSSAAVQLNSVASSKLEIDTASGSVTLTDCVFTEVEYDGASSRLHTENCTINDFDMDTASGDAVLNGSVGSISFDSASGSLTVNSSTTPDKIEADTASGDVSLTIPADSEFTLEYEKLSGDTNISDFVGSFSDGKFVCGNGIAEYEIDTASGNLTVRAGK